MLILTANLLSSIKNCRESCIDQHARIVSLFLIFKTGCHLIETLVQPAFGHVNRFLGCVSILSNRHFSFILTKFFEDYNVRHIFRDTRRQSHFCRAKFVTILIGEVQYEFYSL